MDHRTNLMNLFRSAGLPEPVAEHRFRGLCGKRMWRFDYAWPDIKIAFEYEGNTWAIGKSRHTSGKGYAADAEKYSQSAICGWVVIRATADMIRNGKALALIEAAFAARKTKETLEGKIDL